MLRLGNVTVVLLLLGLPCTAAETSSLVVRCGARPGEDFVVSLQLENPSAERALSGKLQPYVSLDSGERSFWAPFTLSDPPKPLPLNGQQSIDLEGKGQCIFNLNLAALKWAKTISALWPARRFRPTVPAGEYRIGIRGLSKAPAVCGSVTLK